MRTVDIVAGVILIALSGFVLIEGLGFEFYTEGVPGPGFFPILLAITIAVCGAILIVSRVVMPADSWGEFERPTRSQAQRSLGAWVALMVAVLLVSVVGFVVAMFFLVAVLLLVIERRRGWGTVATIVLTPLLVYLLFGYLLQVRLPVGLFGD